MHKFLIILPLVVLLTACSSKDSLENQGQQAGAAADNAIERVGNQVDAAQDRISNSAVKVSEKAQDVKQDVQAGLGKIDKAANAAEAELKK